MIKFCACKNVVQDEMYGLNNRVHNTNSKGELVCTVCRSTNGFRGKTAVRKHPIAAAKYKEGANYNSCVRV